MEDKILNELKQIRQLLSELIGTAELPASEKFSKTAIAKAAKEYADLLADQSKFRIRVTSINLSTGAKKSLHYKIPDVLNLLNMLSKF